MYNLPETFKPALLQIVVPSPGILALLQFYKHPLSISWASCEEKVGVGQVSEQFKLPVVRKNLKQLRWYFRVFLKMI